MKFFILAVVFLEAKYCNYIILLGTPVNFTRLGLFLYLDNAVLGERTPTLPRKLDPLKYDEHR